MARYNIYYRQYSIIARATIPYVEVVDTEDIYHEIGKMICQSLEKIESIRYTKPQASQEDCEKFWTESGYRKLTDKIWIKDKSVADAEKEDANKTEQIEKIARIICESHNCEKCAHALCADWYAAERLYNAGCRVTNNKGEEK